MADVFDEIAPDEPAKSVAKGDVFDQLSPEPIQAQGDVFDQIVPDNTGEGRPALLPKIGNVLKNVALGVPEAAANVVTGFPASMGAAIATPFARVFGGAPAAQRMQEAGKNLTYQPQTIAGQAIAAGVNEPFVLLDKGLDLALRKLGIAPEMARALKEGMYGGAVLGGVAKGPILSAAAKSLTKAVNSIAVNHPDAPLNVQEALDGAAAMSPEIEAIVKTKIVQERAKAESLSPEVRKLMGERLIQNATPEELTKIAAKRTAEQEAAFKLTYPDIDSPEKVADSVLSSNPVDTRTRLQRLSDAASLEGLPVMRRYGSGDAAIRAGGANNAVKYIAKDLESLGGMGVQDRVLTQRLNEIAYKDAVLQRVDDIIADPKILDTMAALEPLNKVHDIAQYEKDVQAAKADPAFVQAVKDHVTFRQHPLDELYEKIKNVSPPPREAGPYRAGRGKYFPDLRTNIVRKDIAERAYKKYEGTELDGTKLSREVVKATNEITPDRWDVRADLTMPIESVSMDMYPNLLALVGRRYANAMMVDLLNEGSAKGWILDRSEVLGGRLPEGLVSHNIDFPYTDENGLTQYRSRNMFVSPAIKAELQQIRDSSYGSMNTFGRIMTSTALMTLAEFASHMKNLHTYAGWTIPQALGKPQQAGFLISSVHAVRGVMKAMKEIASDSPEVRSRMAQKAMAGEVRPEYSGTGAWYDKMLGPTHHAIMEVDDSIRYMADKAYDEMVADSAAPDTLQARSDFVNRIGQYIPQLMNPTILKMKRTGLSPFAVATAAFTRLGKDKITGYAGFKPTNGIDAAKIRATGYGILASYVALPLILNMITVQNPLGRPGTPLGAIDWGDEPDPKTGKFHVTDPMQLMGIRRFEKGIGLEDLYQGMRQGLSASRTGSKMTDAQLRMLTQFAGPPLQFGVETVFGTQVGTRDYNRRVFPEDDMRQKLENFRAALEKENPAVYRVLLDDVFRSYGYGVPRPDETYGQGVYHKGLVEPLGRATGLYKEVSPALSPAADLAQQYSRSAHGAVTSTQEQFDISQLGKEFAAKLQTAKTPEGRVQVAKEMTEAIKNSQLRIKQPISILKRSLSTQQLSKYLPGIDDMGQLENIYEKANPEEKPLVADRMGLALRMAVQKGNVTEKDLKQHILKYNEMRKTNANQGLK